MKSSAESLLTVINDILDVSKIEAGKLDIDEAEFSLRDCLGEALKTLALRAHEKDLELALRVHPEVPDNLLGDPTRLRQIIFNLVGNSIKFTDREKSRSRSASNRATLTGPRCTLPSLTPESASRRRKGESSLKPSRRLTIPPAAVMAGRGWA